MKVKCIKFLSPIGTLKEMDSCTYMTKGKEYVVLGLGFSGHARYVYIEDDDNQAICCDIRQFEITSQRVPSNWVVEYREKVDSLSFYPKSWLKSYCFFERYVDQDPEMIELYIKERDLIYQEESK